MNSYYEVIDDVQYPGRWHLNGLYDANGVELDPREFTAGRSVDVFPKITVQLAREYRKIEPAQPLLVTRSRVGHPLDFTFAAFDMPVVSQVVADLLKSLVGDDIQTIPARTESSEEAYRIANVTRLIDCIDTEKSEIQWWEAGNEVRPDLAGTPELITKLVIDSTRAENCHIFRPKGWRIAVIVSNEVKFALEKARVSGIRFRRV